MNKDTFLTTSFKDGYVHSCYNRDTEKQEYNAHLDGYCVECKSLLSAKRQITKLMQQKLNGIHPFDGMETQFDQHRNYAR
jgi:hypothetical protein